MSVRIDDVGRVSFDLEVDELAGVIEAKAPNLTRADMTELLSVIDADWLLYHLVYVDTGLEPLPNGLKEEIEWNNKNNRERAERDYIRWALRMCVNLCQEFSEGNEDLQKKLLDAYEVVPRA